MSLFNVCNWWSTQCSDLEENYDVASLLCARFGLEDNEKDYIVVGTHGGNLSIFYPQLEHNRRVEDGNAYRATDLLLEICLKAPILGVYAGRFSGGHAAGDEKCNQLAILHPHSVAIYKLQTIGGVAEHGAQLRLHSLAEYKLQRGALALTKGAFGRVKGREFFCITHLDGTLTFHEQDGILYECQMPGQRALPLPVVYCERNDSFLRFTAGWNLECFTYQDLAHSSINRSHFQPAWTVCVGEGIVDICVVQLKNDSSTIMILGERNFIALSDNGIVDFILKLDYTPKCFHSFIVGYYWEPGARLITAIVSDSGKLLIYDGAQIIWAAQYKDDTPVAIQRSNLCGLPGGIVALGANGQLHIGYLGSEPFLFKVPLVNMPELSFAQAQKELLQLEEEIRAAVDLSDAQEIDRKAVEDVRIHFTISREVNEDADALLLDVPAHVAVKELPACNGCLRFKSKVDLAELQIMFAMPEGVRCNQEPLTYVDLSAGTTESLELEFYVDDLLHIHTARIDVIISFISTRGIPRVIQQSAYMPLQMFFKIKQPQKTANIKLTYNITADAFTPKLSTFFPEFLASDSETQALGLLLLCPGNEKAEEIITIVMAKNSNRLRIQSDSLETFPMILERIVTTALDHAQEGRSSGKSSSKQQKLKNAINSKIQNIMANPVLPIHQILHAMDVHRETQENIRKQTLELDMLWLEFKDLQRKMLERSEDEPKEALVMQIEENYDHLIAEGDKLMEMRKNERVQRCDLTCAISVATWIIGALRMEEKLVNVICAVLRTPIDDWTESSWEESMSPGIDMLYHYGPLNRVKNAADNVHNASEMTGSFENFDYNRFRRHALSIFERIQRIAATTTAPTTTDTTTESNANTTFGAVKQGAADKIDISSLNQLLTATPNDGAAKPKAGALLKQHLAKHSTLEAVEDDEEEYDEEDLRKVGYKKEFGSSQQKKSEESEWVNESYELPSSEELFSDLGIWW